MITPDKAVEMCRQKEMMYAVIQRSKDPLHLVVMAANIMAVSDTGLIVRPRNGTQHNRSIRCSDAFENIQGAMRWAAIKTTGITQARNLYDLQLWLTTERGIDAGCVEISNVTAGSRHDLLLTLSVDLPDGGATLGIRVTDPHPIEGLFVPSTVSVDMLTVIGNFSKRNVNYLLNDHRYPEGILLADMDVLLAKLTELKQPQ